MNVKIETKKGQISMPWWAWGVVAVLLSVGVASVGSNITWVNKSVMEHETRIEINAERIRHANQSLDRIEEKVDDIHKAILDGGK